VLCNLECPVTSETALPGRKPFEIRTTPERLDMFDRRFVLGLANNHVMDYGPQGLQQTIGELSARGLAHAGAGQTLAEACRPAIVDANGLRLAIVCAADPRYEAASDGAPGTFPAEPALLQETLRSLRGTCSAVVVSLHMGLEYVPYPTPRMGGLAELCLAEGAALVVFHHSHCLSGATPDPRGVVLWGTGNYIFPWSKKVPFAPWFDSAIFKVRIGAPGTRAELVEIVPVTLDAGGLPAPARARAERRIRRQVERISAKLQKGGISMRRCLLSLLRPSYLIVTGTYYVSMARAKGVGFMLQCLAGVFKNVLKAARQ
jgi:poly-gamma-glutamate synthesis protein (capsule biosynthesis protein)